MSAKFHPISLKQLLQLILNEYAGYNTIFGIPKELFFFPGNNQRLKTELFKHKLDTPLGVAAGPHSQMAQNIVVAWLMGARYIELKTIQTLDEIEVPKPCIDMQDEGYNCEWSQELNIRESFNEYLNSWIIIHILNHKFGWGTDTGTIYNMSAGYDMKGILNDNVQWFFEKMQTSKDELTEKIEEIRLLYPQVDDIDIPYRLSDNITLSTMHGCPANEIEEIAEYFLREKGLHTFIKLNPTLLGPADLRDILNKKLGFKTIVTDSAFNHDLKYHDATKIIRSLQNTAKENNRSFGLKLTNTLESVNNKDIFGDEVEMMYMSGRALHPLSINLAVKLQQEFDGELMLSFSAGTDAFNIADIISCGFKTVTVCSDILKPGGYMRFNQYFINLHEGLKNRSSNNISEFIIRTSDKHKLKDSALLNLIRYGEEVLKSTHYKREYLKIPDIKTKSELGYFDCISAPCRDTCPTNQDIPEYLYFTSTNQVEKAYKVILRTNPFPAITGMICDHLCQNKCTRVNYDEPLQIREIKRFISCQDEIKLKALENNGIKVAIIGAGPAGLSCAYYLALAGFAVEVFEAKPKSGGMVRFAIPGFRLTERSVKKDFKRVTDLGVKIHYNNNIDRDKFHSLKKDFEYLFIAAGARLSLSLEIDGADAKGILEPLNFLFNVKAGKRDGIGKNVVIIGGGNTAMDAARTAYRLVGQNGKVTILYRRTINEMPADQGEIKAVLEEGVKIIELASPEKIIKKNGNVKALICSKMELKGIDSNGRPLPVRINNSEFEISCDTVIPAIGQKQDLDFAGLDLHGHDEKTYRPGNSKVYIGGDALRGASTAINAIGDGRKVAEQIIRGSGIDFGIINPVCEKKFTRKDLMIKRSKRIAAPEFREPDPDNRRNFRLVSKPLNRSAVREEASRCLYCDEICNICTTVCPNFANYSYEITPFRYNLKKAVNTGDGTVQIHNDRIFEIRQKYQILNIANFCNECGNCNTFCPTMSAPFREKPRVYLTASAFKEAKEGYYLTRIDKRKKLFFRRDESIETLTDQHDEFIYETDYAYARISKNEFDLLEVKLKTTHVKQVQFEHAAVMSILIRGAENLLSEC
jgi:putative selenate reductase